MQLLSVTGLAVSARSGTLTLLFHYALRRTGRGPSSAVVRRGLLRPEAGAIPHSYCIVPAESAYGNAANGQPPR